MYSLYLKIEETRINYLPQRRKGRKGRKGRKEKHDIFIEKTFAFFASLRRKILFFELFSGFNWDAEA
jgi:hypothetical protein